MSATSQISAHISSETRDLIERYASRHGVKKSFLIETALLHHLRALDAIPVDLLISPSIQVSQETGGQIRAAIKNPAPPTQAMKDLMND